MGQALSGEGVAQCYTAQSLLESLTLAPPGGAHHEFSLVAANGSIAGITLAGQELLQTDQDSLPLGEALAEVSGSEEYYTSP